MAGPGLTPATGATVTVMPVVVAPVIVVLVVRHPPACTVKGPTVPVVPVKTTCWACACRPRISKIAIELNELNFFMASVFCVHR